MNDQNERYFQLINDLRATRTPFTSVLLVDSKGHVPQDPAAKMLVGVNGRLEGTVGGGKIEARALQLAMEMLARGSAPQLVTWNLQTELGMSCGGEASLFFETHFSPRWRITVFGAGHVAQALIRLLIRLDCSLTCVDSREEWLTKLPQSPRLKTVLHPNLAEAAVLIDENSFVAVMTQGHATDLPILKKIFSATVPAYIGVIGSAVKGMKLRRELVEAGVPPDRVERLHCPIGLPVGTNDPEEIAISIAAQMMNRRDERDKLRHGTTPPFWTPAPSSAVQVQTPSA